MKKQGRRRGGEESPLRPSALSAVYPVPLHKLAKQASSLANSLAFFLSPLLPPIESLEQANPQERGWERALNFKVDILKNATNQK